MSKSPTIVHTRAELAKLRDDWKRAGATVGVVPTMGALHEGHLSLVRAAVEVCDRVIVTIFVNPKQFNNPEDLANYPRTEQEDARKLKEFNVDVIYAPNPSEVYPEGHVTTVSVAKLTDCLCGTHRPGHFDGVATVVAKLFLQTGADKAFFGEKDFQQLQVVRQMTRDLDIPTEVVACETVREASGLALSSRNLRLGDQARHKAVAIYREMQKVSDALVSGADMTSLVPDAKDALALAGFDEVEYFELRTEDDLSLAAKLERPSRIFVAAWIDGVRLIDNIPVRR